MTSTLKIVPVMLALLCGMLTLRVYSQTPAETPDDVIRVDTDLTSLFFTASDRNNRYITSLRQEDLRLTEDGLPQTIVTFQRETDRPLSIAFLIDVSSSEELTLPEEKAAARGFIETVIRSSKDQAAIIAFTGSAYLEQDLTRDVLSLYRALERVDVAMPTYLGAGRPISGIFSAPGTKRPPVEGMTAIWEAVALTASRVLTSTRTPEGQNQKRRAIILLTDGWDTASRLNAREAIAFALSAETVIYAIGIGDSKKEGVDKYSLETLAESTGGRAFFPKKDADLKIAFAEIERELRSQYLVAYSSTNKRRDGSYRHIRVDITTPILQKDKLRLRYRPGYYALPLPTAK